MSWFDIVRKESDAQMTYDMYGTYSPQDIPGFFDDDDELTQTDINDSINYILSWFSSGYQRFEENKVYKIDELVKEMKDMLEKIKNDSGDDGWFEWDDGDAEEALTELVEKNTLKNVIIELLKDTDNNEMGYMIGGDSFKLVDIYEEPYNKLETYVFQTEEELRNA